MRGLFQGFTATAVRDAPYAGLYVVFYEKGKELAGELLWVCDWVPLPQLGRARKRMGRLRTSGGVRETMMFREETRSRDEMSDASWGEGVAEVVTRHRRWWRSHQPTSALRRPVDDEESRWTKVEEERA